VKRLLLILFIFGFNPNASAQSSNKIEIGEKLTLHSKILNENRDYWLYLPKGYSENKKYPVIYLLDGNHHFHTATGVLKHMSQYSLLPDMILVAILNTDRTRDLTPSFSQVTSKGTVEDFYPTSGGSKNFLNFIKTELMPAVEKKYSTQTHNMLIGHSFGAIFTLYALLEEPDLFQSYISIDPSLWWDNELLIKLLKNKLDKPPTSPISLYIAAANNPEREGFPPELMIRPQKRFFEKISVWNSEIFNSKLEYFADESHGTVPLIALFKGISFIFKDFKPPINAFVDNPSLLASHYGNWSKRLGYRLEASERVINRLGLLHLRKGNVKESIRYLELNVERHPLSANTYDSLGEAYFENGQLKLAIENYEKSLRMDDNNKFGKSQLKKLYIEIQKADSK